MMRLYMNDKGIVNKGAVRKLFASLKAGTYELIATKADTRTIDQNSYYWIAMEYVKRGLQDAGFEGVNTKEDAHFVCKCLFLKTTIQNPSTGEVIEKIGSSRKLTKEQFGEYTDKIIQWAAEYLNVVIPTPNTQQKMFQ